MSDSGITKRALALAMKSLMTKEAFSKISVGEICAECGMNRKSFYYHFRDKYDLVNWIFYTEFIEAIRGKNYLTSDLFLDDACRYFYDNKVFYLNALEVEGQNCFSEYFGEVLQPILLAHFCDIFDDHHFGCEHGKFYAEFCSDAFLVSIKRWLGSKNPIPPEEYLNMLRFVKSSVAKYIAENTDTPEGLPEPNERL